MKRASLQTQLLYAVVQLFLLAGALLTSGIPSVLLWTAFAVVTFTKYAGVMRTIRRKREQRELLKSQREDEVEP